MRRQDQGTREGSIPVHPAVPAPHPFVAWYPAASPGWWLAWGLLSVLVLALGYAVRPYDPDLPLHLLQGEWLLEHGSPMPATATAWTNPPAHNYAYSWLPEVLFVIAQRWFGEAGLRLMYALPASLAVAGVWWLGRVARWPNAVALWVAAMTGLAFATNGSGARPIYWCLALVPWVWATSYRVQYATTRRALGRALLWVFGTAVLAVNTHLFFPLLVIPYVLLLEDGVDREALEKIGVVAVVTVAGWLCTPFHADVWSMFQLAGRAVGVMRWPTLVRELQPGFSLWQMDPMGQLLPVVCAAWLLLWPAGGTVLVRAARAIPYLLGLVLFGMSARFGLTWWLLMLPLAGESLAERRVPKGWPARIGAAVLLLAPLLAFVVGMVTREADMQRTYAAKGGLRAPLPTVGAAGSESFLRLLQCALPADLPPTETPRIATHFFDGRYVAWRVFPWRVSQTTTGLFRDRVVSVDRLLLPTEAPIIGPWTEGDVAIVRPKTRAGAALRADSAYALVAAVTVPRAAPGLLAYSVERQLWVRRAYWARHAAPFAQRWIDAPFGVGYGTLPRAVALQCRAAKPTAPRPAPAP